MNIIKRIGGPALIARWLGIRAPSVVGWRDRIPADRCPGIELASGGKWPVEILRPDVSWQRVPDASWPHPDGRPCIDVAGQ
jgi:DNA-binding transcriptional regulator YdaS (Cro superfamily)